MPHPKLSSRSLHMATHDDDKKFSSLEDAFLLSHCSYTLIQQARHGIQIVLTSPLTPCADDWIIFGTTSSALTSVSFIRTLARRQGRKGCPA